MAEPSFRAPKGTRDILPPESGRRRALIDAFAQQAELAGFGEIMSPIFEDLGVFKRLGESTDVVTKEMFDFFDKGDPPQHLALRPELTASVCRAFAEHRPTPPWKVWYEGPQFRYEQPQAGRYRQFAQVGIETLGTDDPQADVDAIALGWHFYESLGLREITLLLNSLGDPTCRPAYMDALRTYLSDNAAALSPQSQVTLERNPLRVLDSKRDEDAAIISAAPLMVDFLTDETREHFETVRAGLDQLGIPYELSPRLVRGLDYYTRTTFEFAADALAIQLALRRSDLPGDLLAEGGVRVLFEVRLPGLQAFLGAPYVGISVYGAQTITYEAAIDRPLTITYEADILRADDIDLVTDLDLASGDSIAAGTGSVVIECRSYESELPPGFVGG